jgi:hypothetical protein
VRNLTLTRRLLGGALIAVAFATSTAPHNHPLGELFGGFSTAGERAVTTHDPHSRASHWHAVIRFVKEEPCLACQWHRLLGIGSRAALAVTLSTGPALVLPPPGSPASVSRFTLPSRGPPSIP